MSMTEFLNRYWTDIVLLAAMFVIAVVFVVIHLLERSARKKSVDKGNRKGAISYEKPDFKVDSEPSDAETQTGAEGK